MKGIPVMATTPQKRRSILFAPFLLGIFVVVFLVLGFITNDVFVPALVALPAAIAGAWALVGWPVVTMKDGRPIVEPKYRPFLFFPLAVIFFLVGYPVLGIFLTKLRLPLAFLSPVSLLLAAAIGIGGAYVLVGFPHGIFKLREQYQRIPAERRPFLFFPLFAVFFLVLYIGLGVGSTAALARFTDKAVAFLDLQVLLLLPITLIVAALLAYLLVGFPKPQKNLRDSLPKVTGKHRPRAFLLTFLLAGLPLTVAVGALLSYVATKGATSKAFLPEAIVLPLAFVLGYSLSLGLAAAIWGTPARWRRYDDYKPGLSPRARIGASGAAALAVALAVVVVFGLAGLDIFWGIVAGLVLAIAVGVLVSGAHKRIARIRGENALLPDMPDRVKSAVLLSTWLVLTLVLFSVLTYALPDYVAYNALAAIVLGLLVAFLVVEQSLLRRIMADRKQAREKRKMWARRRKEALAKGGSGGLTPQSGVEDETRT